MESELKLMARSVPRGACPNCGHKQFVVIQHQTDLFLTDRDGVIIDGCELSNLAVGKCGNCGREIQMLPTLYGFVPLTQLRKAMYFYGKKEEEVDKTPSSNIQGNNPMLLKEDTL